MKLQVSVSKSRSLNIETWVVNVEWTGPAGRLQLLQAQNTGYNNVQRNTLTLERPPHPLKKLLDFFNLILTNPMVPNVFSWEPAL